MCLNSPFERAEVARTSLLYRCDQANQKSCGRKCDWFRTTTAVTARKATKTTTALILMWRPFRSPTPSDSPTKPIPRKATAIKYSRVPMSLVSRTASKEAIKAVAAPSPTATSMAERLTRSTLRRIGAEFHRDERNQALVLITPGSELYPRTLTPTTFVQEDYKLALPEQGMTR